MYRKIELLSILFVVSFYLYGCLNKMPMSIVLIEDILMPIIFIGAGFYKKRFLLYVVLFVFLSLGIRLYIGENIIDPITSLLYFIPYGLGGYFLNKKNIKWPIYVGVSFLTLFVLMIPTIGVDYMSYLKMSQSGLIAEMANLENEFISTNIAMNVIRTSLVSTIVNWGFPMEILTKITIAFFALKIFSKYAQREDYTNSIAFFHRNYGYISTLFLIITLGILLVTKNMYSKAAIVIFVIYYSMAGASVFLEWRFIYRTLKKSLMPSIILLLWVFLLLAGTWSSLFAVLILLSYSVYVTLNGRDNLNRLLLENIEKLKEIKYGNNIKRKD